jgi:hypothetical protein
MDQTAAALYQRHQDLQLRLRLLEAEALDLDGKRGAAVLEGGDTLAQLHQRVAEVERERADVAAAIATLGPQLDAAQEREREQAREELRAAGVELCRQRLEAAGDVDRALMRHRQLVGRRSRKVECCRRYAAAATPLTSAQTAKARRLAARYSVVGTCSRRRGKRLLI